MNYPDVRNEFDTMYAIARGASIARFGDGELKMASGAGYSREEGSPKLAKELRQIFKNPTPGCIVGIPTMDPLGPKGEHWARHKLRFTKYLNPEMQYYSSLITRPDSAPWIQTREYAELVQTLWVGKRVAILCEAKNSILKLVRKTARCTVHVRCPNMEAYALIDRFESALVATAADLYLMSCGATATCLANRLTKRGLHAVDIGSAGGFLLRLLA